MLFSDTAKFFSVAPFYFIDAYKFYNELSKKYVIKYFDYKSLLADNYFSDPDHLNIKGSIEFTKVVLNDCFKEK